MRHDDREPTAPSPRDDSGAFAAFPPILNPDEAARMLRISKSTLYSHVSSGKYRSAVKRGKPLRFLRDALVREFFRRRG